MKVTINETSPDGVLVNLKNIYFDTYKEATEFINKVENLRKNTEE